MSKKTAVSVLCGGQSTEHEISVRSAQTVLAALDLNKFDLSVFYITHRGEWYFVGDTSECLSCDLKEITTMPAADRVSINLGAPQAEAFSMQDNTVKYPLGCVIPMLHGTHGEDGCMQGLLQLINAPYVGANVLASSMCMNKDITKQLLRYHHIQTIPWAVISEGDLTDRSYQDFVASMGAVLFVKPVSLGSSVGIAKVSTEAEFLKALYEAFRYEDRVMVEPCIVGREIECAVLGNEIPIASLPGEIVSQHSFYSYEAKYQDPDGAKTIVPAPLPNEIVTKIREIAVAAFNAMQCCGMLRVDFFVTEENEILVNEVNTMPGFTSISLYPMMWEASGIDNKQLLEQLVQLAITRHQQHSKLERMYMHLESPPHIDQLDENRLD